MSVTLCHVERFATEWAIELRSDGSLWMVEQGEKPERNQTRPSELPISLDWLELEHPSALWPIVKQLEERAYGSFAPEGTDRRTMDHDRRSERPTRVRAIRS